jgi:hypothetical protein
MELEEKFYSDLVFLPNLPPTLTSEQNKLQAQLNLLQCGQDDFYGCQISHVSMLLCVYVLLDISMSLQYCCTF